MKFFRPQRSILLIALLALVACSPSTKTEVKSEMKKKIFKDAESKVEITAPQDWVYDPPLNESADIAASSRRQGQYLIVIGDDKENLAREKTLESYAQGRLDSYFKNTFSDLETPIPQKTSLQKIGNYPVLQYEYKGVVEGINLMFVDTFVETSQQYYRILAWSVKSSYPKNKVIFDEVIQSFRQIPEAQP